MKKRMTDRRVAISLFCLLFVLLSLICSPYSVLADTEAGETEETTETEATTDPSSNDDPLGSSVTCTQCAVVNADNGIVMYAKGPTDRIAPASTVKLLSGILAFEYYHDRMNESITVTSASLSASGGFSIHLKDGEVVSAGDLLRAMIISNANDAASVLAYNIGDNNVSNFVRMMNERAASLGMSNTHFVDCCGLTESPDHYTTARDIAIMSRELINKYPQIHNYSTIWMENITHVTKQGTKEFGLSNTNKLLKMATNFTVTGLKTGSTSIAKYCLSATAEKDGVRLIAAIMAAPDFKARFADAQTLLNYGYANCKLYEDKEHLPLPQMPVTGGVEDEVGLTYEGTFSYLSLKGEDLGAIEKKLVLLESVPAPVEPGQKAGVLEYSLGGKKLGEVNVLTNGSIREAGYMDYLKKLVGAWKLNRQ